MRDSARSDEGRAFFPSIRAFPSIHGFRGKFQFVNVKFFFFMVSQHLFLLSVICVTFLLPNWKIKQAKLD